MDGSFERDGATATAPAAVKKQGVSPKQRRLALMIGPPVLIAIIAAVWLMMSAGYVSTDNAQISAARAPITSSVRARVVEILVTENQKVKAGDELVKLDGGDFAINVAQAALGATLRIPTLEGGQEELELPPGTQNGAQFRKRGLGVPHLQRNGRGDMLINVRVVVPAKLSVEQKELFRQLAKTFGDGPPEQPKGFFDRIFGS